MVTIFGIFSELRKKFFILSGQEPSISNNLFLRLPKDSLLVRWREKKPYCVCLFVIEIEREHTFRICICWHYSSTQYEDPVGILVNVIHEKNRERLPAGAMDNKKNG